MRRRVLCIVLAALASACGSGGGPSPSPTASSGGSPGPVTFPDGRVTVRFSEGAEVRAEMAVTTEQIGRGLMFRERLGPDEGMLFLFQIVDTSGFYMKDTLIPLSIAYMRRTANRTYEVVAVLDMDPCPKGTTTCPTYPPNAYYDAALEVNEGWFERSGVEVGDTAVVEGEIANPFDQPTPAP